MLRKITRILALLILILSLVAPAVTRATDMQFNIGISVITGLIVNRTKNLVFPDTMINGGTQLITVAPTDPGAAEFFAQGQKNKKVTSSVLFNTVTLSAPGSSTNITVDLFTISGPNRLSKPPGSAPGTATFKIGARATITPTTEDGDYTGTNTFRLVYN
jgi:hypothetical protein